MKFTTKTLFRKALSLIAASFLSVSVALPQPTLANSNHGVIGGCAYEDANGNNIKDLQEECFPNVRIGLVGKSNSGENISLEVFTDENGWFFFRNLPAGTYTIRKLSLPAQTADHTESISEFALISVGGVVNLQISNLPTGNPRQQIANVIREVTIRNDVFQNVPLSEGGELIVFFFGHTRLCSVAPGPNCRPTLMEVGAPPVSPPPPEPPPSYPPCDGCCEDDC